MTDSKARSSDAVARLREALATDRFALYCQPVGALGRQMTYPFGEVLVRMREEEQALLPPGEFLAVLEHYDMMWELERWIVRRVVEHLAAGSRLTRLAVNVSQQTLADAAFPAFFADALAQSGVHGDCLLFEVDERDAIALPERLARFAANVGSLGAGIVIEAFGRAADPWEALKAPCVQFVKLHDPLSRRLLAGERLDEDTRTLLTATSEIGIEPVADGVEDLRAVRRLKAFRIRYVQGLGVYGPHPLESFAERPAYQVA